jgi:DNA helicase II / ATP-dependent DNA helicase PcrA
MDYLDSLNESQREAVINTEGPSLIVAGAGSGKTRVLTLRIAHLIQKGVDPFNILALTFTNKASKEMRSRIQKVIGTEAGNIWMGTFHSVFARILRAEAEKLGYPSNFTIYDTDDSKSLIKQIVKEQGLDEKVYKANVVLNRISSAKNRLISSREYVNSPILASDDAAAMKPETGRIYQIYQERCFKAGAMDFDDLLFNTNVLFKNHADVLNKYQNKFKYVLVDEFQDTNLSQYLITKKLAAQNRNIAVVGDDAQSIYAFRGADIQNILNFEKDYPELKVFKLEQNYRSTQTIVNAANSIISNNKAQLPKNVWTDNEEGKAINLMRASSDNEEGRMVATSIFEERMQNQASYNDFAILYRTNSQSRSMEEALRKLNIQYRIVGGLSFYQRKEIKDLLAYLRFCINTNDEQSLRRIINYPKRGIGDTTLSKLLLLAEEQGANIWDILSNISSVMSGRTANAIQEFATQIKAFQLYIQTRDAFEAATYIAKESGILKELYDDKTTEGLSRYENIQELLNGIKEYVDNEELQDKSLGLFLQEISLLTDADKDKGDEGEKVTLMTIHSSKGLEFKYVYIVGMEEDLFPSQMMLNSRADLEEERRLFYVAVTRAERNLFLSFATSRYRYGRLHNCEPSRFLNEIDQKYINFVKKSSAFNEQPAYVQNFKKTEKASAVQSLIPKVKPQTSYTPSPDFKPSDTTSLKEGMKVEHPKFGYGVVKNMDIAGSDRKATIEFKDLGEKTLILSFAKLKIHES